MDDSALIVLEGLEGNAPTQLHGLQKWLAPFSGELALFWWCVFAATALVLVLIAVRRFKDGE